MPGQGFTPEPRCPRQGFTSNAHDLIISEILRFKTIMSLLAGLDQKSKL